jgi:hypothetical protein
MIVNFDYFATAITNTVEALDQTVVLRLSAEQRGIAVFPERDQTVVSPLLLQCHWNEPCIQAHWAPRYGPQDYPQLSRKSACKLARTMLTCVQLP